MAQATISSNESSSPFELKIVRYFGIILTLGLSLLFVVLYSTQMYSSIYDTLNTYYSPIVAFIAFVLIFIRAQTSPNGANSRRAYFGLSLAVIFYFLGEFFFILPGVSNNYPSIADLWWAIGTIFFIDELFFMVSVINVHFTKKQLTFIYGITALSVVSLIVLVFGAVITQPYNSDPNNLYTPFMKAMDLFYFTGDVLILFGTIYVVFGLFSKTGFKISLKHLAWIFLILGNLSMIAGDTFYSYFNLKGPITIFFATFTPGQYSIDNLLYVFQYMFWALSFAFFPEYLARSFSHDGEGMAEEFTPLETKKKVDDEMKKISDVANLEQVPGANSLPATNLKPLPVAQGPQSAVDPKSRSE